jgi:hypothetical protein
MSGVLESEHQWVTAANRFANVLLWREGWLLAGRLDGFGVGRRAVSPSLRRSNGEEGRDRNHKGPLHVTDTITTFRIGAIVKRMQVLVHLSCRWFLH